MKGEIPSITNLATKTTVNAVENEIPSVSNLVGKTDCNTKINEFERKITDHNHDKYITTTEFNQKKLTSEKFAARLKQANLACKSDIVNFANKTDFDDKIKNLNKKITSNKTEHVLVETELNELTKKVKLLATKDYSFFLGRKNIIYK